MQERSVCMRQVKEDINIDKVYGKDALSSVDDFIKDNNVDLKNGLRDEQVKVNIEKYGINEIKGSRPKKWYNYFFDSLFSPFNSILMGIILVLLYTDVYLSAEPSWANIIVIAVIALILIIAIIIFFIKKLYYSFM